MQDDGDADVARARDGDGLLNLRDGPDVRELVEDEVDGRRQLAAVVGERLAAELVDALPHHDGEQEGERLVGIREDAEDRHLRVRVAESVKLHLIVFEQAAHTGGGDGSEAHVAGDDDGLEGLARRDLEVLVVHEGEVLIGRQTAAVGGSHAVGVALEVGRLPRPIRVSGRVARPEAAGEAGDAHRRRGGTALARDVALSLLDLQEKQVERGFEVLIVLAGLGHGEQRQQARQVVVLRREPVAQQRDEGGVQHLLGVLPEWVSRLAVAIGVHDVAVDERQDVGVRLHVLERVVVHGFIEIDGVERLHLVAVVREQEPRVLEERALGVGDEIARVELTDVRGDVVERLAGAGAAHDQNVQVAVEFGVELGAMQGEAEVLREDEVVVLRGEVAELLALLERAPSCRTALLTGAEVAHEGEVAQPEEPDDDAHGQARQHGVGGHVEMGGCIGDEGPHEGEAVAPVLEELPAEGRHRLPIAIPKIETYDGDRQRHQSRGRDLLVDFRVSLALSHKRPSFLTLASRQGAGERDGDGGAGGRRGSLREALVAPEAEIVLGADAVGVTGAGAVVALKSRRLPTHGDAVRADDALAARLYLVEQVPEVGGG